MAKKIQKKIDKQEVLKRSRDEAGESKPKRCKSI
ncbi:hypothetical protein INT46_011323 [Mucor plumbeus]|uniref:Uncharacterized protein n=1 Tax=Mucor plumbeus TaxID=97098 RepID=A0A8H7V2D1_9FUNG|nr:hypothetical protein INT46_011323 [Mucor plumbeus]